MKARIELFYRFCVFGALLLLLHVSEDNKEGILKKIRDINASVSIAADGAPSITVSAGVVFGQGKKAAQMFRMADEALYQTKENGRRGCTFYGDETKPA